MTLLAGMSCAGETDDSFMQLTMTEIESPAATGSGEPNLTVDSDGGLFLSWIETTGDGAHELKYARLQDDRAWSASLTIASGDDWLRRTFPQTFGGRLAPKDDRDGGDTAP